MFSIVSPYKKAANNASIKRVIWCEYHL